ncbi:HD domain-containing protein [Thermomicrobium sp. 4228-Ro]|uniref:HD domain-containing protein n=1 Tax=Thermomicrobium sp. 4228-Ro TaxID=2993937 RepID=UPI0022493D81|nr:HD domain-containing protein [Thermomicrobium sp. 4228-Ro]MCX2726057.1 HD domain-containing protein [Thermomicrobium sp. 4228-Ro]
MLRSDPSLERARAAGTIETPDPEHSEHVAFLALRLFDQLRDRFGLPPEGRDYLAAAALWHDAGQFRSLAEHHRYSFDRIMAVPLKGFDRTEQLAIANIARYHRAAEPSPRHPQFQRLPYALRRLVEQLAAILRIAEGLDASHQQFVEDVSVEFNNGYITIHARSKTYPTLEVEKAQARAGLFRAVFGKDVLVLPEVDEHAREHVRR